MDNKLQVMLILALATLAVAENLTELPKPSYARTMLKVSRSLPGETEELKVRTSEGNLATLIVKRREKSAPIESPNLTQTSSNMTENVAIKTEDKINQEKISSEIVVQPKNKEEIKKSEDAQIEELRAKLSPESQQQKEEEKEEKPVTVADNKYTESTTLATTKNYEIIHGRLIDYGRWTPLSQDGRALNLDSSTDDYQSWKPLSTELKTNVEKRPDYVSFSESTLPSGKLLFARNFQDRGQRNVEQTETNPDTRYTFLPHQIRSSRTNIGANLSKNRDAKNVPPEVVVRSEINVKSNSKRTPMTLDRDGTPVVNGRRVPDEPLDKVQTWRNARVINNKLVQDGSANLEASSNFYPTENLADRQRFERFLKTVNRRYGRNYDEEGRNVFFEWDPKNYKNEALKAEVYESRTDSYRSNLHKRMLHPNGISSYPSSQLYTPESQKIVPVPLKAGARAPVLQYAHPELGVQPAKIVKNEKRRPDNFPENQHSFTEQRQKKKYVLNDKNIVDSYTIKNYYPNQHFYGLKKPSDTPFWVKISENLKNQFSTSVEKMSQFTRPVIDPLVEATHKISQNLGLSKGKEAQDKLGTVSTGTSILIPALGLVASGAALGIGAVAVGRYLDVDVLKRSNEASNLELERQRALDNIEPFLQQMSNIQSARNNYAEPGTVYIMENVGENNVKSSEQSNLPNRDSVLLIVENGDGRAEETTTMESTTSTEDVSRASSRRKRSVDYLDIFKAEGNLKNLVRSKRLQRKGADSISEIVEIDLPVRDGNIEIAEFLIPKTETKKSSNTKQETKTDAVLVLEDSTPPMNSMDSNLKATIADQNSLEEMTKLVQEVINQSKEASARNSVGSRSERQKRSTEIDQELNDVLQNLENAEIAEVAHIDGDWTNTPCAKRIFCDAMVQKGPDAAIFMEKKMAALLGLIQPTAAVQVSSHFGEVMDAVRRHNCSRFLCPQARPGNVFF